MSAAQREGQVGRAVSGTPGVPGAQPNADDSEPIVSLPLKDTTDADKGNATPVDQGVTFDSGGAHFALDSQMVIPDVTINNDAGSVSLCLQPQWGGGDPSDASLFQLRTPNVWGNRLQLFKNGRYLRFILADETGTAESDPGIPIDNWQPNQPHLITSTWGRGPNGEGIASLFVDGQLASQKYFDGQLDIPPGTPMYLGSDLSGGAPGAQGSISNFQVYGRALPAEEIANLGCQ